MTQNFPAVLEALLFAAPEPLSLEQLQEVLEGLTTEDIRNYLNIINATYEKNRSGLIIIQVAGGYRMTTRPEFYPWLVRLARIRPTRLSRPALETLAIVAYRQPITKAEIETIRGVAVDGVIKTLAERGLIRILGRKREAGRPILYGTSRAFLEYFGFKDLSELPSLQEIEVLTLKPRPEAVEESP
jgi:segregation and condensation protein B